MACDSLCQNIDPKRFFRKEIASLAKTYTTSGTLKYLDSCKDNDDTKVFICAVGINDTDDIVQNLCNILKTAKQLYPSAKLAYSKIFYSENGDVKTKDDVEYINNKMKTYCNIENIMYIDHNNIKSNMFRDNKHIARKYTGILVNNLHSVWKPNTTNQSRLPWNQNSQSWDQNRPTWQRKHTPGYQRRNNQPQNCQPKHKRDPANQHDDFPSFGQFYNMMKFMKMF